MKRPIVLIALLFYSMFLLSGCFVTTDIPLIEKGEKARYLPLKLVIEKFQLIKSDYSNLKTQVREKTIDTVALQETGPWHSRSYTYRLGQYEFKFKSLDHKKLKNVLLVQVRDKGRSSENGSYAYFHALIDRERRMKISPLFQNIKKASAFFSNNQNLTTSHTKYTGNLKGQNLSNVLHLVGNKQQLLNAVMTYASKEFEAGIKLLSFTPVCQGLKILWNSCIGKTQEKNAQGGTTALVGPYLKGKKEGEFFRKYTELQPNGEEEMWWSNGLFKSDEKVGWWRWNGPKTKNIGADYYHEGRKLKRKELSKGQHYYEGNLSYYNYRGNNKLYLKSGVLKDLKKEITWIGNWGKPEGGKFIGNLLEGTLSGLKFKDVGRWSPENNSFFGTSVEDGVKRSGYFVNGFLKRGRIVSKDCVLTGRFYGDKEKQITSLVHGKIKCQDGTVKLGEKMTGCKSNKWGGSIYVETPEYRFIGKTNSDCSIYQSGIQIFKRSGEAYAVVHRKGKFKRIKRVELLAIVRESGLRELPWLSKKMKVNNDEANTLD
tara:strand:- start:28 stop:1656 length:1629 start_codon:yes stop_codon:yes gene_type:complete